MNNNNYSKLNLKTKILQNIKFLYFRINISFAKPKELEILDWDSVIQTLEQEKYIMSDRISKEVFKTALGQDRLLVLRSKTEIFGIINNYYHDKSKEGVDIYEMGSVWLSPKIRKSNIGHSYFFNLMMQKEISWLQKHGLGYMKTQNERMKKAITKANQSTYMKHHNLKWQQINKADWQFDIPWPEPKTVFILERA